MASHQDHLSKQEGKDQPEEEFGFEPEVQRPKLAWKLPGMEKSHRKPSPLSKFKMPQFRREQRGGWLLGLSILSFFCIGIILGPIVLFNAMEDLRDMKKNRADSGERGLTQAAFVLSILSTSLNSVAVLIYVYQMYFSFGTR